MNQLRLWNFRLTSAIWLLTKSIEAAVSNSSYGNKSLIFIAGDFNRANTAPLCQALQLHVINKEPTYKKGNLLDLILINTPDCYSCNNMNPLGGSDHMVVIARPLASGYKHALVPTKDTVTRPRPHQGHCHTPSGASRTLSLCFASPTGMRSTALPALSTSRAA